jgi:hypothetical protein
LSYRYLIPQSYLPQYCRGVKLYLMYEFVGSKSAKLVVTESGKLVARFLQYIACYVRV